MRRRALLLHWRVCGLLCALASSLSAAAQPAPLGVGGRALPGFHRVPVVAAAAPGATASLAAGYGLTESQPVAPGGHHRVFGQFAVALTPLAGLDLSLVTSLRHDRHAADALGPDQGTLMGSELFAQWGARVSRTLHLGLGGGASFARGESLQSSLESPALDLQLLGALLFEGPFALGASAGFRHDRSAGAMGELSRYRAGDRLALGVSEFDAVPLALAGLYRHRRTELVGELSGELLAGRAAPALSQSPLRASVAVRHALSDRMALRLATDTSLSARPRDLERGAFPIEPRWTVLVGWSCALTGPEPEFVAAGPAREGAALEAQQSSAVLEVNVTTGDGEALSDAKVELVVGDRVIEVPHESRERYRLGELPAGAAELRVSAERLTAETRAIQLRGDERLSIAVALEPAPPSGQLRGLVRSFDGTGLSATVRVEPNGIELSTAPDGSFALDVAPGRYEIVVRARGHEAQRRSVRVTADGVVILNADLQKRLR